MMKEKIVACVDSDEAEQFTLLRQLVLQQSSSYFKPGVDAVGKMLADALIPLGMRGDVVKHSEVGNQLIFRSSAYREDVPSVLLIGHMDTVFPVDSPFDWYRDDGVKVYGPGVIDMKGGLVVAVSALKALSVCGLLDKIPLALICNSDEEIGSPASTPLIKTEAMRSLFALGFECGGLNGEIVTGRKGKAGYRLTVRGVAGHAAFAGANKASAILEMAHKVIALEQLNDPDRKIVVNVGVVHGGIGPNTVADKATAEIDTRFLQLADAADTASRIEAISQSSTIPGTLGELEKTPGRLPMEQNDVNRELYQLIRQEADVLKLSCQEELRSGVSDANTIAETGIPVVDGMGPIGDCDHSDREYMVRDSLPARSKLATCAIVRGWEHFRR